VGVAREYFAGEGEFVYTIRPRRGEQIDVNSVLGKHDLAREQEISIKGGIPTEDIVGARRVGADGKFDGPFIKNPSFTE
jgi:hypothetical protein